MKKQYISPAIKTRYPQLWTDLLQASLSGNTGSGTIGSGGDDNGGENDPDAKYRGGLDGYGNLW